MKIIGFRGARRQKKLQSRRSRKSIFQIKIKPLWRWHPYQRQIVNGIMILASVLLCLLMLPTRFLGMEVLGIGPNWFLIWVVAWSVKRTVIQGALAGIILGLLQDGMTSPEPTHVLGLGIVGATTALLQKQRFIQEDFISIALIVFGMSVLAETIFACQLMLAGDRNPTDIWSYYQKVALASAIVSSLWAPVVYFPLNLWWQKLQLARQKP